MIFDLLHHHLLTDFIYSFILFSFRSTISTKYPLVQKFLLSYLYFKLTFLSNILNPLLTLQTMLHLDIVIYRLTYRYGLDMIILQWSPPFFSHNFLMICPLFIFSISLCFYILVQTLHDMSSIFGMCSTFYFIFRVKNILICFSNALFKPSF